MHDGAGQAAAQRMVEEDRVEDVAGRRVEAEGDVREAEDDLALGDLLAKALDGLQRPQAELAVVVVAGADREGQRVEQQIRFRQTIAAAGEIAQPPGDGELVIDVLRHPPLVDGEGDNGGPRRLARGYA